MVEARPDAQASPSQAPHQPAPTVATAVPLTVIQPVRGWRSLGLRDLWVYRELFYFFLWRDLKVRYRQTVIGVAWALLVPFVSMVVFTVFFGNLAGIKSDGAPYAVFLFAAMLPWNLFASALTGAGMSIASSQALVTKVYFPRLIIPISSTLAFVVDFLISCVVMAGLMAYYQIAPTARIAVVPLLVLLAIASALAAGLWLAALNARYRDIRYTLPFLTQFWFFLTPVLYPTGILPDRFTFIYGLNPMVGVVQGFRWALIGSATHGRAAHMDAVHVGPLLIISCGMVVALLVGGLAYFRRTEAVFADLV